MAGEYEGREAGLVDLDAQLLLQLPDQRRLRPLAGLDLAARELPQTRQLLALRPLRDQHAAVRIDECDGYHEDGLQRFAHSVSPTARQAISAAPYCSAHQATASCSVSSR